MVSKRGQEFVQPLWRLSISARRMRGWEGPHGGQFPVRSVLCGCGRRVVTSSGSIGGLVIVWDAVTVLNYWQWDTSNGRRTGGGSGGRPVAAAAMLVLLIAGGGGGVLLLLLRALENFTNHWWRFKRL